MRIVEKHTFLRVISSYIGEIGGVEHGDEALLYTRGMRGVHPVVYPAWWEVYTLWYTRHGREVYTLRYT